MNKTKRILPINVFSLVRNLKDKIERSKKVNNIEKVVYKLQYDKQPEFVKNNCRNVSNYINSSHYTFEDLKNFLFYTYLFQEKINYNNLKYDEIIKIKKLFTDDQYKKDQDVMLGLSKRLKIKKIDDYFKINDDQKSLMFDLIINKFVSPLFYIKMLQHTPELDVEDCGEHRRFRTILSEWRKERVN